MIINELRDFGVPRTGLEPARLAALAPETSASTIPPPGLAFRYWLGGKLPLLPKSDAKLLFFFEPCNRWEKFVAVSDDLFTNRAYSSIPQIFFPIKLRAYFFEIYKRNWSGMRKTRLTGKFFDDNFHFP